MYIQEMYGKYSVVRLYVVAAVHSLVPTHRTIACIVPLLTSSGLGGWPKFEALIPVSRLGRHGSV